MTDCGVNDSCLHLLRHSTVPEMREFIKCVDLFLTAQEAEGAGLRGDSWDRDCTQRLRAQD